jgi:glucose/arabinose dehydrogenase
MSNSMKAALAAAAALVASPALANDPVETGAPNAPHLTAAVEGQTRAPGLSSGVDVDVLTVAVNLDKPWGMTFLPDGRLLVTGRTTFRVISQDGAMSRPVRGAPEVDRGDQGGILDVVLDPDFAANQTIYFTFSEPGERPQTSTAVARARLVEGPEGPALEGLSVIYSQSPKLDSRQHYGGRILFDREGHLFITTGERYVPVGRPQAQDLTSGLGKVMRIRTDGSVPADNPFVGRADAQSEIWSYGHRNVQGAALDPGTGQLWTIEHGPRGGDELNLTQAGRNYGWPVITYGIEYNGAPIGDSLSQAAGMEQPVYYWDPVIAPSGMAFYTSDATPAWKNSLFIAALRGKHLARLTLENGRVTGEERLLTDQNQRLRDVEVGPDGSLWVLTDGNDAKLLKITPRT